MGWVRFAVVVAGLLVCAGSTLVGVVQAVLSQVNKPPVVEPAVEPAVILKGVGVADAKSLRDFYAAMADVVVRDGKAAEPVCKTTLELRNRHKHALQLAFAGTYIVGAYPGLGDRLDAYLLEAIGGSDVPLTPELRESAAKAFLAIK